MRARRYEVRDHIWIEAPPNSTFAIASDPAIVPRYESDVKRIDILRRDPRHGTADVRSHLSMLGLTFGFDYRYRYRVGIYYGGVQQSGRLMRGYFSMRFRPGMDSASGRFGTDVEHVEGIISRVPGVARLVGWLYFRVLSRGGIAEELKRLKQIVEHDRATVSAQSAGAVSNQDATKL
jgi:hypothetical protein